MRNRGGGHFLLRSHDGIALPRIVLLREGRGGEKGMLLLLRCKTHAHTRKTHAHTLSLETLRSDLLQGPPKTPENLRTSENTPPKTPERTPPHPSCSRGGAACPKQAVPLRLYGSTACLYGGGRSLVM